MQNYVKIYLDYFGYTIADTIPCEMGHSEAVDVHHIHPRGMGGNPAKDVIENLMGLCRKCHDDAEAGRISREELTEIHMRKMGTLTIGDKNGMD